MQRVTLRGPYAWSRLFALARDLEVDLPSSSIIEIDMSAVSFLAIGPLTLLLGKVLTWQAEGHSVTFSPKSTSSKCFSYLQRMNFFDCCKIPACPEQFIRRDPNKRFVEYQTIGGAASAVADSIATKVADCLAPTGGDTVEEFTDQPPVEDGFNNSLLYSVSELVKNVQQHSRGIGYITAQEYPTQDRVDIAIVDNGIGIWESFNNSGSPHASQIKSDAEAIKKALQFQVSSKNHSADPYSSGWPENEGVGLTFLKGVAESAKGRYFIVSNKAGYDGKRDFTYEQGLKGTFLSFSFGRSELDNFSDILETTKQQQFQKAHYTSANVDWEKVFQE